MAGFKMFLGASVAITFVLKLFAEAYMPSRHLIMTAFEIFGVQIVAWLVWRCLLYPNLFSPLRALPGPSVCPIHQLLRLDSPSLAINRAVHS